MSNETHSAEHIAEVLELENGDPVGVIFNASPMSMAMGAMGPEVMLNVWKGTFRGVKAGMFLFEDDVNEGTTFALSPGGVSVAKRPGAKRLSS